MKMASSVPRALALVVAVSILLVTGVTSAQSSAAAQALFDDAVALRDAGNFQAACPKFAESLRLDPTVGTRFNLADCYERIGKLASAWSQFLQVAADTARAGEQARADAARARAKRLEPRLSKMIIQPAASATGMVVKRDGVVVGQAQWGTALPVDGGSHVVEASAPGRVAWSQTVTVAGDDKLVTVDIPALAVDPNPANAATPGNPTQPGAQPGMPAPGEPSSSSTPMILGLAFGGLGVVGLGIGTAMGVVALGKKSEVDDLCPDLNNCTEDGIAVNDEAKTAAMVSTIGFIAGGALLVTGIVLWVALPSEGDTEVGLELSPLGAGLSGRF